jgi:hypothetical protein
MQLTVVFSYRILTRFLRKALNELTRLHYAMENLLLLWLVVIPFTLLSLMVLHDVLNPR